MNHSCNMTCTENEVIFGKPTFSSKRSLSCTKSSKWTKGRGGGCRAKSKNASRNGNGNGNHTIGTTEDDLTTLVTASETATIISGVTDQDFSSTVGYGYG